MKLKPSPFLCRAKYSIGTPTCASMCAALAFSFLYVSSARAATRVWDGGATVSGTDGPNTSMNSGTNWGTPGSPTANVLPASGDTLEFSGFDSSTTDLVMNAAMFASPGAIAAINVNQTNPLTFASGAQYLRMASGSNFTVTNGAVSINGGRIVFGVGSLTTESFTLTNNSASPVTWGTGATTPIAVGTGPAAGGGRNMTFAGSGDWVFNSKFDGATYAVLTKTGAGTLTLNATGNLLANIATTPLTISQGSIVIGGAANLNGGAYASPIANSAALVYSSSANQTLSGAITGTGSLTKNTSTSSILTLAGANNYSGATTLSSGTLAITGSSTVGSLSVADQTTLAVKVTSPSVSPLKPSSLTLGAAPTDFSNLNVDFAASTNPTAPLIDLGAGSVTLNGEVDVSLAGLTALTTSTNTIKLLKYGSLTGTGSFYLLTTFSGRSTFELNQTATALYLNVTALANVWKGTVNNTWDSDPLNSANWSLPDGYQYGDTVIFNDTTPVTTVDIPSTVYPSGVTFSNSSARTYTLTSGTGSGIGGSGPLVLSGTNGTVVITNANTYTGTTTIGTGNTLRLGDGTTDGTITNTTDIINNGTLVYNRIGTTFTYNGVISGSGSVLKEGIGTQRLGVANTYSGGTTINGGDLQIDNGNAFGTGQLTLAAGSITARGASRTVPNLVTMSGDFTLNTITAGNNVLTLAGNVDLTGATRIITVANTGGAAINGVISNGGLTKAGTGTLTLTGINTYTGPTLISEGLLQIGNGTVDGSIDTSSGIQNNGTLTYNFAGQHTISLPITGSGALTKIGAGIARFSNTTNSYTGTSTVTAGAVVKDAADSTTGDITVATDATFVLAGGITDGSAQTATISGPGNGNLNYFYTGSLNQRGALQAHTGNNTWAGNIALSGTAGTAGNTRIGVQNDASLTLTGNITEAVAGMSPYFRAGDGSSDTITLAGTCSWTGATRIFSNGGSVKIGGNNKLPTTSDLIVGPSAATLGSPTFDLGGFNQSVAGLVGTVGTVAATIKNSGVVQSTLTLNPAAASSFPGNIQDNVKLVIGGVFTQTLAGLNRNTGDTTINSGANLTISSAGELRFYPTTNGVTNSVGGTGTLQYNGTLRIDLGGSNSTPGNSWTLVNVGSLANPTPFSSTFAVSGTSGTFTETPVNSGIWKLVGGGKAWTFTESDGKLTVAADGSPPYETWINTYFSGVTDPAIVGKGADPDGDGTNNLAEFALNGNPNNGADNGYKSLAVVDTNANSQKDLTLTIAVRKAGGSPVFAGSPLSATSDGVKYTIEGSLDLAFPTSAVSEASPATGTGGLPADYEYRRFRLDASEGLGSKGFLRVKTEPAP
ncbi:MAG: autotransporter-associated beta strand repeat-containing protein [Luteolibacter sp.]|uniref:beta strand repeat-containing protein n=1 Tax=Luteolibacter sp. TaxID=1962973 RepID=UPI00326527B5